MLDESNSMEEHYYVLHALGVTETKVKRLSGTWACFHWLHGELCIGAMGDSWHEAFVKAAQNVRNAVCPGVEA